MVARTVADSRDSLQLRASFCRQRRGVSLQQDAQVCQTVCLEPPAKLQPEALGNLSLQLHLGSLASLGHTREDKGRPLGALQELRGSSGAARPA